MSEKYDFIEIIGQGMYGKVFKALNKYEQKYYAIKTLNIQNVSQKERLNIETEIKLLQELKHPNIVLYKESFLDENQNLNIVTTFCEGGDLYQRIFQTQKNYFPEKTIINALVQLLLGLSYIHDKKIVHRDIKTKNIFIQNEHTLRIGDFGIAKIFNSNNQNNNKNYSINKMVGTPLYMAPECFKQNKKYSYKSDIWSLGCCIYEMCNLKHAFEGQFFPAVSVKISEGKRLPVNKIYSKELRNIIDYMLDLNMRNRPTIAFLLEKTFVRKYVGEYIIDFVNNYRKYEANEEQINILKEQAEKFKIFKVKLNQDNLNGYYINSDNNYNNKTKEDIIYTDKNDEIKNAERNKRIKLDKKYFNKNEKKEFLKTNDNLFEEKKSLLLLDQSPKNKNKKLQINNFIFDNKIIQKQQNTINYNNYNETDYINSNNLGKKKNRKLIKYKENHRQKILTDKSKSNIIDDDSNITNKSYTKNIYEKKLNDITNEKKFIIYKRINYFKEKTIKALGTNFYNKAYNYLKNARNNNGLVNNDIKREYLSNTFGKNNIGYWQLIDQILFLENILETF